MFELVTPPESIPVALEDLKDDLDVEGDDDNDKLLRLLIAATEEVESECRRQLVTATWKLHLDSFPSMGCDRGALLIEKCPVASVTSITYVDTAGDQQTLSTSNYRVDTKSEPARITPAFGMSWPVTRRQTNAVTVQFVAGYGDPEDVPQLARQCVTDVVREKYEGCGETAWSAATKHRLKWGDAWQ